MANYQAAPAPTTEYPRQDPRHRRSRAGDLAPVIGIIVSAIALSQSKSAGLENKLAKIGIIVGIVLTVLASYAVFSPSHRSVCSRSPSAGWELAPRAVSISRRSP